MASVAKVARRLGEFFKFFDPECFNAVKVFCAIESACMVYCNIYGMEEESVSTQKPKLFTSVTLLVSFHLRQVNAGQ